MGLALILAIPVAVGLGLCLHDLILRPNFRRLAMRNVRRRRNEALLVIGGSMLGTAIIAAAFVVGDSFSGSIRDVARTSLGPVDEIVRIHPTSDYDAKLSQLTDRVRHAGIPHVDGVMSAKLSGAVLANEAKGDARLTDPSGCLLEVDAAEARHFGRDPAITGFADIADNPTDGTTTVTQEPGRPTPPQGRVDARCLRARRAAPLQGDRRRTQGRHCRILRCDRSPRDDRRPVGLGAATGSAGDVQRPSGLVFVSNDGGVFDSVRYSDDVTLALQTKLGVSSEVGIESTKADTLKNADDTGSSLQSLFSAIGGFSVIAGILLLINLFVMLAEERKVELGVLRAIGMKRSGVWRAFSLEGAIYSATSAVLGSLLGVAIGWGIILGTNQIFSDPNDQFTVSLFARFGSLSLAAVIGGSISMLTVWGTSVRISRLNVISAVRDLPDPRSAGRRIGRLILAALLVVAGAGVTVIGFASGSQPVILAGPPVALFALIPLLGRIFPLKPATFLMAGGSIVWCLGVFSFFPGEMSHPGIGVFVEMGILLVAAAVTIATTLDGMWDRATLFLTERGKGLATRLALAYPLARRFRTGMLLGMFSLVIFTMTFIGTFSAILSNSTGAAARDIRAGFDVMVDSNRANPLTATALRDRPEIADVATLLRANPKFTIRYEKSPTNWGVAGFDADFLAHGSPLLKLRSGKYSSDHAAFEAVLHDPKLIIVDQPFLQGGGGPTDFTPRIGDHVDMINGSNARRHLTVVGVLRSDAANHGSLVSKTFAKKFLAPQFVVSRAFVKVKPGQSATVVARRLNADYIGNGVEAETFAQRVADQLAPETGFIQLMQVYLGFGLLIGIAGLGVVMVRAVRERRREIGMLRAMGVSAGTIRRAFLIEATFIAVQAALTGVGLGLITTDQVVVNSGEFSSAAAHFTIPWITVVIVAAVPIIASVLATISPAHRASRIRPAVALRMTD
jgi:putative ABC transport system permease protein